MAGIFLNYRGLNRSYAPAFVDRELVRRFGPDNVFQAGRSNPTAADFPSTIMNRLAECTLLIALIDPVWIGADIGLLWRPTDWVRREIAWALANGLQVLPVLLDGAEMPKTNTVPPDIAELTHRQALRMRSRSADADLLRLIGEVERLVPDLVLGTLVDPEPPEPELPAALLHARYEVMPFRPRPELDRLIDWCLDPTGPRVRVLTGGLGEGKTRIALRLTARLRGEGWPAGLVSASAPSAAFDRLGEIASPCLVVIDDAETRPAQVEAALRSLATTPGAPARLLLVARATGEWLDRLRRDEDDRLAALVDTIRPLRLAPWQPSAASFATACVEFARRRGLPVPPAPANLAVPGTMLELQAAALAHVLAPNGSNTAPLRRIIDVERGHWLRTATSFELPEPGDRRLSQLITAVTLFGADTETEADNLLAGLPTFQGAPRDTIDGYRDLLRVVLPGTAPLNPLQPEQLADHLIADIVGKGLRLAEVSGAISDRQADTALVTLGRCLDRHPRLLPAVTTFLIEAADRLLPLAMTALRAVPQPEPLVAAMTTALDHITPEVLDRIVAALPQRSEPLAAFAVTAVERAFEAHRGDDDPLPAARLALRLATRLAYLEERPADGVTAARFAVIHLTVMADSRDAETLAELAEARAALAIALDLDPTAHAEALEAGATAIDQYRTLAENDRNQVGLASALHHQSDRLRRAGDIAPALAAATEAHALITPLADRKPAAFRSLHTDILDNLAVVTALSGDPDDAEQLGRDALAHRRTLAAARPDAYRPQLAGTLHNVGRILARHDNRVDARTMLAESVTLYDDLAAERPNRFTAQRDIARAHLAEIADGQE